MTFKDTAKRMGTAAAVAGGAVMAATSGMLQDPAYPIQQALQAPDMKSAALAAVLGVRVFGCEIDWRF